MHAAPLASGPETRTLEGRISMGEAVLYTAIILGIGVAASGILVR